ncbi:hypothetical protein [Candidatus Tisiphia endosymbiont of Xenochironomus xenolabis]|uniref:hypothetical protein n=1 Tax=Candidatus Tisiphia endosymbiont of Xenochironomus xenolabis TaxID=3139334 RepID=UPI0035C8CF1F
MLFCFKTNIFEFIIAETNLLIMISFCNNYTINSSIAFLDNPVDVEMISIDTPTLSKFLATAIAFFSSPLASPLASPSSIYFCATVL